VDGGPVANDARWGAHSQLQQRFTDQAGYHITPEFVQATAADYESWPALVKALPLEAQLASGRRLQLLFLHDALLRDQCGKIFVAQSQLFSYWHLWIARGFDVCQVL
jgi:hypothetical protein